MLYSLSLFSGLYALLSMHCTVFSIFYYRFCILYFLGFLDISILYSLLSFLYLLFSIAYALFSVSVLYSQFLFLI